MVEMIENRTFDEIAIGDSASISRALRHDDIETWAAVTGNLNLIDIDPGPADSSIFALGGGHTMWGASLFGTLAGSHLPGLGSVSTAASMRVHRPIPVGEMVTATVTVKEKRAASGEILLDCLLTNAKGEALMTGTCEVLAPRSKIRLPRPDMPKVQLRREDRYLELLRMCDGLPPSSCAVVHPCSEDALRGAIDAADRKLITPILVGPEKKIRTLAAQAGIDLGSCPLVPADHSHHAAEIAVGLVRTGEAQMLMKGSLHTDELLSEVLRKEAGLRTERRLSHCFLIAVPTYARPIIVTDAAINIMPTLEEKRDIVQNAIELAHAVGIAEPKVAILSAVETVTVKIPSTIEAAALCKMAERGQITGGVLDGPLAFDNAISMHAAQIKQINSPVAGHADILAVPDLESGNMLAKQLEYLAGASGSGLVVGARIPIALTSRAEGPSNRVASALLGLLAAHNARRSQPRTAW